MLVDTFWAVARQLRALSRDALAPLGISPSQSRALAILRRHGPMRLGSLSEHLRIAPRSATEVVDALQRLGLLVRDADPQDRRATVVSLTAEGQALSAKIKHAQRSQAKEFFNALSEDEQRRLVETLGKLVP